MRHYRVIDDFADDKIDKGGCIPTRSNCLPRTRPNTAGVTHAAIGALREFAKERKGCTTSLNEVSSSKHALLALYEMKDKEFVQEDKRDDATLQILRSIPMAYQVDILTQKYKAGDFEYPTPEVVWDLMGEMEDEAIFGPGTDRLD